MSKTIAVNFVAKHSYIFVRRMIEGLVSNDCKVFAIVSGNMPEIDQWRNLDGVELYEVDGYSSIIGFPFKLLKMFVKDAPKIRKRAKQLNVKSVYLPIFTYWSMSINWVLKKYPFVYAMHDPQVHESKRVISKWMNTKLGEKAQYIVILSEVFRKYVMEHYKKYDAHILTIPSGDEAEDSSRVEIVKYDPNKINFLFQGRIDGYKGLDILSVAYELLAKEYKNISLTIAGSGDFTPYQEQYKNLPNCEVINRWLSDEEVKGLFNDTSVITVLPYKSATQSGVINVAMPNGSPIIATNCGGITEQIVDNETGFLVEPNDAVALYEKMKYVLQHTEDLQRIRENGYKRMSELSWDNLASPLAKIL